MSWPKRFLYVFWTFVILMLLWQAYQYNKKLSTPDPEHPTQTQFFHYMPDKRTKAAAAAEHDNAFVEQTGFRVEDNTPTSATFTCHVTLKNTGKAKAVNIQVRVRPYFGTTSGDADDGQLMRTPTSVHSNDDNILGQIGQWVEFPDLAAGVSSTQSVVFTKQANANYGKNPSPEIIFQPEKK